MIAGEFHFLRPGWLLALLPAALILWLLWKNRLAHGRWSEICDAELLPFLLETKAGRQRRGQLIGAALATLVCILALAGPTWQRLPNPAFRNDSALVIALDLSKSMNATDSKPSRLAKARFKISDLLHARKDGQTALLVFGGDAFTLTPLTTDTATINSQLEALNTSIMPSPGSNLQLAIDNCVELLRQAGMSQGHILVVTDTDGGRAQAPDHYTVSVLAVGSETGAPIPMPGGGFVKDSAGNMVIAKLDRAGLSALAAASGGLYQDVTANDDDVKRLGSLFNRASPGAGEEQSNLLLSEWDDKGPWLALLLLPWAALRFRKGLLSLGLLCMLPLPDTAQALDWQSLWLTPNQQAQRAFDSQQFEQAAEAFDNPDWRAAAQYRAGQYPQAAETLKDSQTADGHYNRGNALAKAGMLQQALLAYQQALQIDPKHADAQYNKDLVEKQLQKQQQDQQQQQGENQPSSDQQQQPDKSSSDQSAKQGDQQQPNPSQQADQKKADQQQGAKEGEQQQGEAEAKQAKPQPADEKPGKEETDAEQQAKLEKAMELQRQKELMLKRIPDQPTELLKRKFRYQYAQRRRATNSAQDW